jgi:ferredoxin--NADP+ reductase
VNPAEVEELRRRHYNATVGEEHIHHGSVMILRVKPDRPMPAPRAGQWLELGLGIWEPVKEGALAGTPRRLPPDALVKRAYSVSSPILSPDRSRLVEPGDYEGIEFFLSLVIPPAERAGRVPNLTGRMFCLQPGSRLFLSEAPEGDYLLEPVRPEEDVLFVATGTGEAPHNLMIWDLLRGGHEGRVASIVSARHREDLVYHDAHTRLAELFPRYRYHGYATRGEGADGRHVQELLADGTLESRAGFPLRPGSTRVYLCGNPGMIGPPRMLQGERVFPGEQGMVELLEARGFNADPGRGAVDVHYERYW